MDDPMELLHSVLYRIGVKAQDLKDGEVKPFLHESLQELDQARKAMTSLVYADLFGADPEAKQSPNPFKQYV